MKFLRMLLLAAGVACLQTSCMTLDMIARAEGTTPPQDPYGRPYQPVFAYYFVVPLTAPLDLITLPVQYFYFQAQRDQPPPPRRTPYPPPASGGYSYDDPRAQF